VGIAPDIGAEAADGHGQTPRLTLVCALAWPMFQAGSRTQLKVDMSARILVVDDDPAVVQALGQMLADEGSITFALNGASARAQLAANKPDLLLLDAELPDVNGLSLCRELRANPATAELPIIIITRHDDEAFERQALAAGASDFVRKPLVASSIRARARTQLRVAQAVERALARGLARSMVGAALDRPARILLVDDDSAVIEALHRALGGTGATLHCATHAAEALRQAQLQPPDLMLLDLALPDRNGLDLLRQWTADPTLAHIPVAVLTQYHEEQVEEWALEAGATDFIAKPFSPAVLQARVRNLLALQQRLQRDVQAVLSMSRRLALQQLATVVEAAATGMLVADPQGLVVLANAAAARLLGTEPSALIGLPLAAVLPNATLPSPDNAPSAHPPPQRHLLQRPGATPPVPVLLSMTWAGEGPDALTVATLQDLTESERVAEIEQRQALADADQNARKVMLAFLAHEIGNPLAGVLGMVGLMGTDSTDPLSPNQHRRLTLVDTSARQIQSLLRDLLDLQALDSGKFQVQPAPLNVLTLCQDVVELMQPSANAVKRHLTLHSECADVPLVADGRRLRQCLDNLISNALKYNRAEGWVRVNLRAQAHQVVLEVADSGLGMTPAQLQQLFQPFNRLGREGSQQGHGLGLALVQRLVVAMGGTLQVRSEAGQGSTFTMAFPR